MSFEWENGRILKNISTSGKSVQMSYDSNGMRTQKTVDGVKTNYYYDSNKNLIALVVLCQDLVQNKMRSSVN